MKSEMDCRVCKSRAKSPGMRVVQSFIPTGPVIKGHCINYVEHQPLEPGKGDVHKTGKMCGFRCALTGLCHGDHSG